MKVKFLISRFCYTDHLPVQSFLFSPSWCSSCVWAPHSLSHWGWWVFQPVSVGSPWLQKHRTSPSVRALASWSCVAVEPSETSAPRASPWHRDYVTWGSRVEVEPRLELGWVLKSPTYCNCMSQSGYNFIRKKRKIPNQKLRRRSVVLKILWHIWIFKHILRNYNLHNLLYHSTVWFDSGEKTHYLQYCYVNEWQRHVSCFLSVKHVLPLLLCAVWATSSCSVKGLLWTGRAERYKSYLCYSSRVYWM